MSDRDQHYELYYWPIIQGRGEFIRLALEAGGASYADVARLPETEGWGVAAMMRLMKGEGSGLLPLAPPFLKAGGLIIAQTANVLAFLGPWLGLVPEDEASRLAANQIQLTIADFASEAHDVHHPIASSLYYEDQKAESLRRAPIFVSERVPKYLGYFERLVERNEKGRGTTLLGASLTYPDLSVFQLLAGLAYAFPRALSRLEPKLPKLFALRAEVAAHPRIAAYLASPRRIPFNQKGLFRHYPELDAEA